MDERDDVSLDKQGRKSTKSNFNLIIPKYQKMCYNLVFDTLRIK